MIGTSRSVWGFDPRSVPGCQLWLDAADATTVTGTTNVTQWRDKSGNGRNTTTTGTVSYANSGISITTSSSYLTGSFGSPDYTGSTLTSFIVASMNSASGSVARLFSLGKVGTQDYDNLASITFGRGGGLVLRPYRTVPTSSPPSIPAYDTRFIATWGQTSSLLFNSINGGALSTASLSGAFAINAYRIANDLLSDDVNEQFNGVINEIVVYFSELTTSERQQIEGYLAHKWGLTGYYDSSIPLSIPGCKLWLDGADTSSITLSGSNVTQWNDKSGNGLTVSAATSQPTYVTNGLNGLGTLAFNGSQGLSAGSVTGEKLLGNTGNSAMFCVFSVSNNSQNSCPITWDDSGYTYRYILALEGSQGLNFDLGDISQGGQNRINIPTSSVTFVNNTYYLVSFWKNGSNVVLNVNGGIFTSSSSTFLGNWSTTASRLLNIGTYINTSTYNLKGNIAEILIYNTHIPSNFKQVEGYLSKKWGIGSSSSIPSTHPFSSIRPHLRTFQPIDVPGCALWLDAADQSSMTLSGSNVTQWNDKSGNGRNVIQTTTTPTDRRPTYSNGVLNFNGANFLSGTNTFSVVDSGTLFAVARHSSTRGRVIDIRNNTMSLGIEFGTTPDLFFHNSFGRWGQSFTDGTNDLQIIVNTRNGSSAPQYARNGGSLISFTSSQSTPADNGSYFAVGYDPTGAQYLNGVLCEIIYYSNALTTSQRQQVEGYLAHKWGLSLSLPVISPLSIPGCQLWLDGADQSSMTLSGSSITQLRDKSGNGNHMVSNGTSPLYNSSLINSVGGIDCTNGGALISSGIQNSANISFAMVAVVKSGIRNWGSFFTHGDRDYDFAVERHENTSSINFQTANDNSSCTITFTLDAPVLYFGTMTSGTSRFFESFSGGVNTTTTGTNSSTISLGSKIIRVGKSDNNNEPCNSFIGEIIYYTTVLTTTQRQQIEGYLARKWGISISATLPSPHPFKSFPPASLHFDPSTKYSALFNTANNSHLSIPANSALTLGTNNHTIEFWLYQTSRDQYNTPFMYGNQSLFATNNYFMNVGTYIGIVVGNGGGWAINIDGGAVASLNEWHHYAIVRNGTTFTFYLNGTSRGSATSSTNITAQGNVFRIGNSASTIAGYISNFRFVNGTAVYTSNFTPPTSPLTAIPNTQILLQGLTDRSPNAFTVTNNGGVTLSTLSPFPPP